MIVAAIRPSAAVALSSSTVVWEPTAISGQFHIALGIIYCSAANRSLYAQSILNALLFMAFRPNATAKCCHSRMLRNKRIRMDDAFLYGAFI
jgi:hypothetical protein